MLFVLGRHTADSRGGGDDGLSDKDFTADGLYLHTSGESYPLKYSNSGEGVKIVHDVIVKQLLHLKWELT